MDSFDQENINGLIIKFLSGHSSPGEDALILSWKNKSEENKQLFNDYRNAWVMSSQVQPVSSFNAREALSKLYAGIKLSNEAVKPAVHLEGLLRIAAVLLLAFIIGGISSAFIFHKLSVSPKVQICRFEAPKGSRAITYLPDGTKVWLNAESILEYTTDFNIAKREVKLTGEGYFKVKPNPSKPFVVKAGNFSVKAFGTSFNVKAYPDENEVTTTLVEGKVEIEGKEKNNKKFTYKMTPKQKVVYYKDEKQVIANNQGESNEVKGKTQKVTTLQSVPIISDANVKTELYTSWKDSLWIIQAEKLEDLAVMLERRYNVNIFFSSNEIKNYRFSGTIQHETLEQIFEIMRLTMPVSYSINKGQVSIKLDQGLQKRYKSAFHQET
jgi:ferric-dicitrate binding protein FerR (iron transport regulator)